MFFRKKIDLTMINPTSKMAMKLSCLQAVNGDVKRAKELYDFLADGVGELPDFPTEKPTMIQQAQQAVGSIFGWVKDNQNDLINVWNFIRQARSGQPVTPIAPPANDIPPLTPMNDATV